LASNTELPVAKSIVKSFVVAGICEGRGIDSHVSGLELGEGHHQDKTDSAFLAALMDLHLKN